VEDRYQRESIKSLEIITIILLEEVSFGIETRRKYFL